LARAIEAVTSNTAAAMANQVIGWRTEYFIFMIYSELQLVELVEGKTWLLAAGQCETS
jgi:hypothetical protein